MPVSHGRETEAAMSGTKDGLLGRLEGATGSDRELDAALAHAFGVADPVPDYTASVDRCLDLVHAVLPGWAWHVGWNATGVLPYATLHGPQGLVAASAATVPLALLKALLRAHGGAVGSG
jgi:hypothetical protein